VGNLVKAFDSSLQDFSNGHRLVDGSSHRLQGDVVSFLLFSSEQTRRIGDVVSHLSLGGNSDLIFIDILIFGLGLINSAKLVHGDSFCFASNFNLETSFKIEQHARQHNLVMGFRRLCV